MYIFYAIKQMVVVGSFLAAGVYLLTNNHPLAGGWCIAGAVLVSMLSGWSGNDAKSKGDE